MSIDGVEPKKQHKADCLQSALCCIKSETVSTGTSRSWWDSPIDGQKNHYSRNRYTDLLHVCAGILPLGTKTLHLKNSKTL